MVRKRGRPQKSPGNKGADAYPGTAELTAGRWILCPTSLFATVVSASSPSSMSARGNVWRLSPTRRLALAAYRRVQAHEFDDHTGHRPRGDVCAGAGTDTGADSSSWQH